MRRRSWFVALALGLVLSFMAGAFVGAAEEPKLKLRLQTHLIPTQTNRVMGTFTADLAAASKGTIEISVFPVGSILPFKEVLEGVGNGTLDMALYPEGSWYKKVPVTEIGMGIPFALKDSNEAKTFMFDKGFINLLREGYAKHNVYVIPFETYQVGLMTKQPVKSITDIKGMKLRAYGTLADFLGKLGASTTQIPGGELYTALATGVVDGAHWGDAGPMYEMKFHEVLKNYMEPEPIQGSWNMIMVNMDLWKKLSPEKKAVIEAVFKKTGDASYESSRALTRTSLEEMAKKWQVQIVKLSDADCLASHKVSLALQDEIAKKDALCAKAIQQLKEVEGAQGR
jgi:TRAP-type C4-dicarboxylate transport system substrate-binding protein